MDRRSPRRDPRDDRDVEAPARLSASTGDDASAPTRRVADYAMIGDRCTGALVRRDGAIDWMCLPRFDGDAVFAALLGDASNGTWELTPDEPVVETTRRYRPETLVLETTYVTGGGVAVVSDFMPPEGDVCAVVRIVRVERGDVALRVRFAPRFWFGRLPPILSREDDAWIVHVPPTRLVIHASVPLASAKEAVLRATFRLVAGETAAFELRRVEASGALPPPLDALARCESAADWWTRWCATCTYDGPYRAQVVRSAITLKALTSRDHGSFVAALTTSLPEKLGGDKNWDYRFTWLRDGGFASDALVRLGFRDEAEAWCAWMTRVGAGRPETLHIMYGVGGEHLGSERELPWLSGFAGSTPVRIFNGAHEQFQLGIYGDVVRAFDAAQRAGVVLSDDAWGLIEAIAGWLERHWLRAGSGIWEERAHERPFVQSKLMVWVAIDCLIRMAERSGRSLDRPWRRLADDVAEEVVRCGYDPVRETFTQSYGSIELDASVLLVPIFGLLPAADPRVVATVASIERSLVRDGLVYCSSVTGTETLGREPVEGAFAMCGFWLVQIYAALGRLDDATRLFERLLDTANDVGLLSEEFDPAAGVAIGNVPQTFSHVGVIDAACALAAAHASAGSRAS